MAVRTLPETRTEKWASIKRPADGYILGDLRALLAEFQDLPDDSEVSLWADGKEVTEKVSIKAVDE